MQKHHDREWHNVKQNDRSLKIIFLHESNRKDRFWQSIKFLQTSLQWCWWQRFVFDFMTVFWDIGTRLVTNIRHQHRCRHPWLAPKSFKAQSKKLMKKLLCSAVSYVSNHSKKFLVNKIFSWLKIECAFLTNISLSEVLAIWKFQFYVRKTAIKVAQVYQQKCLLLGSRNVLIPVPIYLF